MTTITPARSSLFLISGAVAALFASTASAQLILNGSFESQSLGTFVNGTTTPDSSTFSNWFVATSSGTTRFSIEDTTSFFTQFPDAVDGARYMAINGADTTAGVGLLYQDFATTPGQEYEVSFTAGRAGSGAVVFGLKADVFNVISGVANGGSLGTASSSSANPFSEFYAETTFTFTASGALSRLIFTDTSASTNGGDALLDNVKVVAVPEPASAAALAGGALLGYAMLRRRRRAAV